jgi:Glycosyl transferase family 11
MAWIAPQLTDGLGNRLFQYAAAAGLAEKWGRPLVFFLPRCGPTNHGEFDTIFKLLPTVDIVDTALEWDVTLEAVEDVYTYRELPSQPPSSKFHILQGYRQTEKYFPNKGITLDFENALGPHKAKSLRDHVSQPLNTWFIHVRLGDYKYLAHHQVTLDSYYRNCLVQIPTGSTLIFMCDEPELCKDVFSQAASQLGLEFVVCDSPNEIVALYLMSLCKGGAITTNSTFGWWGAYLAHQGAPPSFRAFYPSSWGKGMPVPQDITPSWGIRMETE